MKNRRAARQFQAAASSSRALRGKRVAVLRDPAVSAGVGQFAVIQSVASSVGVEVTPINPRDAGEIERGVAAFARSPNGGLILTAGALGAFNRDLIKRSRPVTNCPRFTRAVSMPPTAA